MYPLIITAIAADHIRERAERAERYRRARQVRAVARERRWRAARRAPALVFRLRAVTLRAAGPATRIPR
jgi:hypothetical protein